MYFIDILYTFAQIELNIYLIIRISEYNLSAQLLIGKGSTARTLG